MRAVLIAAAASLAAIAIPTAGANAQSAADAGFTSAGPGVAVHRNLDRDDDDRRRDRRRHRGRDTVIAFGGGWGPPEAWALYNNRTFDPQSFNDWWHERPWRAYPRWVREAPPADCDRMWWGGGAWRCTW